MDDLGAGVLWEHLTPANVLYSITTVAGAVSATMAWLNARRGRVINESNSSKLDDAKTTSDTISRNVNGHLDDLKCALRAANEKIVTLIAENAALKAKNDGG